MDLEGIFGIFGKIENGWYIFNAEKGKREKEFCCFSSSVEKLLFSFCVFFFLHTRRRLSSLIRG